MDQDVLIFEVSENNFPTLVLGNSHKLPVLACFLNVSSGPCAAQEMTLDKLAREFAGRFIFAKIDVAEQASLRQQYHIEQVPTMLVFQGGKVSRVEMGQLQEDEARSLLAELGIFHPSDRMREQAREKHLSGDTQGAILLLTEAIRQHPGNLRVALDMVQIFIDIADLDNARSLFMRLPTAVQESEAGLSLKGQMTVAGFAAGTDGLAVLQQRVTDNQDDHQARFELAVCLLAQHDSQGAMDALLQIIAKAPEFKEGAARELLIGVINTIKPNNPQLASDYQRQLGRLLAS
ncbi:MAG: tetratricopeptide repeat protein [Thiohalomonadaceae bacterium]